MCPILRPVHDLWTTSKRGHMTYVVCRWLDAHCALDSITVDEARDMEPVLTVTVGHLVHRGPLGVVVAVDAYPDKPGHFANWHFIGTGMLVDVRELVSNSQVDT